MRHHGVHVGNFYLFDMLDDATRLVPNAHFALGETAADCLVVQKEAVLRRGLPEGLFCGYVARHNFGKAGDRWS